MQESDLCDIIGSQIMRKNKDSLSKESSAKICLVFQQAKEIFDREDSVLTLDGNFSVVGDLHGNVDILLRIFNKVGYPDHNKFIFLGDYVDRGSNSVEVLIVLFTLKCLFPHNIYLIRGNHECRSLSSSYGFRAECEKSYTMAVFEEANKCFDSLPVACVLNNTVFCVHGGISPSIHSREELYAITKTCGESAQNDVVTDFMWSDPSAQANGFYPSERGAGYLFGKEAAKTFLDEMGLQLIVRSHESCNNGFDLPFGDDGQFLTIFSAADYCGNSNRAGIVLFNADSPTDAKIEFFTARRKLTRGFSIPSFILSAQQEKRVILQMNDIQLDNPRSINPSALQVIFVK